MRISRPFIVLSLFVIVAPAAGVAGMLPIFGPKQYTRTKGPPDNFTDTFQNCEAAAQYKTVVLNGNPDGTGRVSSASISLNGTQVFGPSDFNQQVARLEKAVGMAHDNQVVVTLESAPGSFLTIDVECTSGCLDVEITSPLSGS